MTRIAELREIIKLCREQGVLDLQLGDVKISLKDLPAEDAPINTVYTPPEVGKDGFTKDEQAMLYGNPLDNKFAVKGDE